MAKLLPASYQVFHYFKMRLVSARQNARLAAAEELSRRAIAELVRNYGAENVAFIHIPQKGEISRPDELGLKARQSIRDAGGRLFDGFKLCHLTVSDYYVYDDHPNPGGYAKIASCVNAILHGWLAKPE